MDGLHVGGRRRLAAFDEADDLAPVRAEVPDVPIRATKSANFTGLVLDCIETKFCKKICV